MRRAATFCFAIVGFFFLSVSTSLAEVEPAFKSQIDMLNELTERRRVNTFFYNEQSVFYGLPKGYVNVGRGNLTFIRRDLVTVGRIPVVFARVFDSSQPGTADFSAGWRISITETITANADGSLAYDDDTYSTTIFTQAGSAYSVTPDQPSDVASLKATANGFLITLRNQWTKRFLNLGGVARLIEVTDNNGNQLTLHYDADHRLAEISGQNGRKISITRNDNGQIAQIVDDQGRTVSYTYNNQDQLERVTDLGGNVWIYKYANDQLHQVIDPNGNQAVQITYHEDGQVERTRIRHEKLNYVYDGDVTTVTDDMGHASMFEQNAQGVTTRIINAEGFVTDIDLAANNQVEALRHNGMLRGSFTYDANGNPERMVRFDESGEVEITYIFDWKNRVVEITGTDGTSRVLNYDANGNLISRLENGALAKYAYNPQGDLISQTIDEQTTTYEFNEDGLLARFQRGDDFSLFSYDPRGRLSRITFPDGNEHRYRYDELGFRTSTYRSGGSHKYYDYDSTGNLLEVSGVGLQGGPYGEKYILNKDNQVSKIEYQDQSQLAIQYDGSGNPRSLDWGIQSMNCEYDPQGRLVSVDDSAYGLSSYQYKDNEPDIRRQLDDRTAGNLADRRRVSQSVDGLTAVHYARSRGTPWVILAWDPDLAILDLPTEVGLVEPGSALQAADQRRRLYDVLTVDEAMQPNFDMASNVFFLPPEYASANCEYGNFGTPWFSSVPATATVGQAFSATVSVGWATSNCGPLFYNFFVNGSNVSSSVGGLSYTEEFTISVAGVVEIMVSVMCTFADSALKYAFAYVDVEDAPPEPSCSGPGLDVFGLGYAGEISIKKYERGTSIDCVDGLPVARLPLAQEWQQLGDEQCELDEFNHETGDVAWVHTHPLLVVGEAYVCHGESGFVQDSDQLDWLNEGFEQFSGADKQNSTSSYPGYLHTPLGNVHRWPELP